MKMTLIASAAIALAMSLSAPQSAFAFAKPGAGNSADAPGQVIAQEKCGGLGVSLSGGVVAKQNANGQTGANTGNNDHDPKTLETAVTECDHFWKSIGAIGPD